jgi:uncharacterized protein (DUF952 family)
VIYHVLSGQDWQVAQDRGQLAPASLQTEGFIHCSTAAQAPVVVRRFYAAVSDLWVLQIDPDRVESPLRWETPAHPAPLAPGEADPGDADARFPHVYGPIPLAAVVAAQPWAEAGLD